jgi:hypothetical protein
MQDAIKLETLSATEILDMRVANALLRAGVKTRSFDETVSDMICSAIHHGDDLELFGCDCSVKISAAVDLVLRVVGAVHDPDVQFPREEVIAAVKEAQEFVDDNRRDHRRYNAKHKAGD